MSAVWDEKNSAAVGGIGERDISICKAYRAITNSGDLGNRAGGGVFADGLEGAFGPNGTGKVELAM